MAGIFSDLFLTVTNSPDFPSAHLKTIDKAVPGTVRDEPRKPAFIEDHGIEAFLKKRKRMGSTLTVAGQPAATELSVLTAASTGL